MSSKKLALIEEDIWLQPYENDIEQRLNRFKQKLNEIETSHGSLVNFANAYTYFGLNLDEKNNQWIYREWAPGAKALFLIGDFNQWNRESHPLQYTQNGIWEIKLNSEVLQHQSLIKVHVVSEKGAMDRIPAYIQRVIQNPENYDFAGQIWMPKEKFKWTDQNYVVHNVDAALIYECHVGMSSEKEEMSTYTQFANEVLPRIKALGYNYIQIMAIQEHPYYGSFGYHVSNFFAPSSKFGTPEDLKFLINKAHEMGIGVLMDIVHSHAVKNLAEGLNEFDGTDDQYFHPEPRGYHEHWDSKLFNYGKPEVLQFLLSNIKYWIEEFHFDGFRFDGVTSMLYFHHGMFINFDHYDKYFKEGVEWDAITYLQLANTLAKTIHPKSVTIAEDMSGMPGMCRKVEEGGIGFDYRLGMGIPDYWIKILKHLPDEQWNLDELWSVLQNRRFKEKTIAYAESHDQALVGDKTLAFWLMDKEMYFNMHIQNPSIVVDRGIALHKLIRLITCTVGGEAYLNFIGNEFGHPEWIDFPREGNNWSFAHARRQWSLADNPELKYQFLQNLDQAMIDFVGKNKILSALPAQLLNIDATNKVIVYERNNYHFVFNFNPQNSIENYHFPVNQSGDYQIVLNTDDANYGGFDRVDNTLIYTAFKKENKWFVSIYLTNRTALVFKNLSIK
jgi:1,4-alpha-glucan branching enzyme